MTALTLTHACARAMLDQAFKDACAASPAGSPSDPDTGVDWREDARNWLLTSQSPGLAAICLQAETRVDEVIDRAQRLAEDGWPAPAPQGDREVWLT